MIQEILIHTFLINRYGVTWQAATELNMYIASIILIISMTRLILLYQ